MRSRRSARARHAVRVAVAAAASYALATVFSLPQGYWAVITAIVVVQASLGATVGASRDRMIGTAAGAAVGALAAWLAPKTLGGEIAALAVSVGVLGWAAAARPSLKIAPVTAVIMILGSTSSQRGFLEAAGLRVAEIAVGAAIGLAVALFVFPARARDIVSAKAQEVMKDLAELLGLYAARLDSPPQAEPLTALHDKIRAGLSAIETAVGEASHESAIRLSGALTADAIPRTLWRLRNDAVMIGRCTAPGLPAPMAAHLAEPAQAVLRADAARLTALAATLAAGQRPAAYVGRPQLGDFRAAFQAAEAETRPAALNFDQLEQVFGLAYALSAFDLNLADLADRISELVAPTAD